MESGVKWSSFKSGFKKIGIWIIIGIIIGSIAGVVHSKVKGKNVVYEASTSIIIDRYFDVDGNGNGFYDTDSYRFWGNF